MSCLARTHVKVRIHGRNLVGMRRVFEVEHGARRLTPARRKEEKTTRCVDGAVRSVPSSTLLRCILCHAIRTKKEYEGATGSLWRGVGAHELLGCADLALL